MVSISPLRDSAGVTAPPETSGEGRRYTAGIRRAWDRPWPLETEYDHYVNRSTAGLVGVFNHRFDKNLPVLRSLHGPRFDQIRFLVPFYSGHDSDVVRVFGSSYSFQSFFAQALDALSEMDCDHWVFLADDMVMNPGLNQANLAEKLGLDEDTGFMPCKRTLTSVPGKWRHAPEAVQAVAKRDGYVDFHSVLPAKDVAVARFREHGLDPKPYTLKHLARWSGAFPGKSDTLDFGWRAAFEGLAAGSASQGPKGGRRARRSPGFIKRLKGLPAGAVGSEGWMARACWRRPIDAYPLAMSYSDFVVVPRKALRDFCYFCGAFASAGVFVECAIPTALLLACPKVQTEEESGLRGCAVWDRQEVEDMHAAFGGDVSQLLAAMKPETLYVHPVKLSQWRLGEGVEG